MSDINTRPTVKSFVGVGIFSILIEAMVTYIKEFFVQSAFSWEICVTLLIGIIVAISYNLDIPAQFNLKSKIPFIGPIITGILLSRGSNYIYDLLTKVC